MNSISMTVREKLRKVAIEKGYDYNQRGIITKMANEIIEKHPIVKMQKKGDLEPMAYPRSYNSTRMTLSNFFKTDQSYSSETLDLICDLLSVSAIHIEFNRVL